MNSNPSKTATPVPDQLMDQLHQANEHFHNARKNLEAQMEDMEPLHQAKVDAAAEGVKAAEREVEAVTRRLATNFMGKHRDKPDRL